MRRHEISQTDFADAIRRVPAPDGFSWQWDPAASSDRLRLFKEPAAGCVGAAYPSGSYQVYDPAEPHRTQAFGCPRIKGTISVDTLVSAMKRVLAVARAMDLLGGR